MCPGSLQGVQGVLAMFPLDACPFFAQGTGKPLQKANHGGYVNPFILFKRWFEPQGGDNSLVSLIRVPTTHG